MGGDSPASSSSSSSSAVQVPPEDAWLSTYQRLLPHWTSFSLPSQANGVRKPICAACF
ncbi:hypothetical protein Ancab_012224 [Ancistrocladus abbreviatus]